MTGTLLSVSWGNPSGATYSYDGSSFYLNAGDTVQITYKFDSSQYFVQGDYIVLSNGAEAVAATAQSGQTIVFTYQVQSGDQNTPSLALTSPTIYHFGD